MFNDQFDDQTASLTTKQSTLPIREHGFALHKGAFRDALALRYGWIPKEIPVECTCGKSFTVEHALSCTRGGFPTLRDNEVLVLTASMLSEVCLNVSIEPALQELSSETRVGSSANRNCGARVDVAADGFGGHGRERTFLVTRVFNCYAPSNKQIAISATYRLHESWGEEDATL